MQRVLVIGCSGAGKTTLSKALHDITGLKLIHLDRQYYRANWMPCEKQEWERRVDQLAAQEHWIMDGNYAATAKLGRIWPRGVRSDSTGPS